MARFLFWNMYRRSLPELAAALVASHGIDVFLIAEPDGSHVTLDAIKTIDAAFREERGPRRDRIKVLSRLPEGTIRPFADPDGARVVRIASKAGDVLLAGVHLRSMMFAKSEDQLARCQLMARAILRAERRAGLDSRTIVVGDFNVDPFHLGMIGTEGFHAVMSRQLASTGSRRVDKREYAYYYNPMWSHFGDHPSTTPPGSYFGWGKHFSTLWHMVDQVLVRPALLDRFAVESVRILHEAGETPLVTEAGRPDRRRYSDHLPLVFELAI